MIGIQVFYRETRGFIKRLGPEWLRYMLGLQDERNLLEHRRPAASAEAQASLRLWNRQRDAGGPM
ncbi:MAG TPA: hypothetical protein VGF71_04150 [Caulobacteraceae bacterium]|jgi:hypothetical protein